MLKCCLLDVQKMLHLSHTFLKKKAKLNQIKLVNVAVSDQCFWPDIKKPHCRFHFSVRNNEVPSCDNSLFFANSVTLDVVLTLSFTFI